MHFADKIFRVSRASPRGPPGKASQLDTAAQAASQDGFPVPRTNSIQILRRHRRCHATDLYSGPRAAQPRGTLRKRRKRTVHRIPRPPAAHGWNRLRSGSLIQGSALCPDRAELSTWVGKHGALDCRLRLSALLLDLGHLRARLEPKYLRIAQQALPLWIALPSRRKLPQQANARLSGGRGRTPWFHHAPVDPMTSRSSSSWPFSKAPATGRFGQGP
jgi:hypothetical protein